MASILLQKKTSSRDQTLCGGREREMRGGRDSGEVRATRRGGGGGGGGGEEDVRAVLSSLVQMDLNYPFFYPIESNPN